MNVEILVLPFEQGDLSVIIIGFNFIFSRESVGGSHVNSSFHTPSNIVLLEEQPPSGLPAAKILGLFEISQVLMIRYDGYWVLRASEVVAPLLQGLNDS